MCGPSKVELEGGSRTFKAVKIFKVYNHCVTIELSHQTQASHFPILRCDDCIVAQIPLPPSPPHTHTFPSPSLPPLFCFNAHHCSLAHGGDVMCCYGRGSFCVAISPNARTFNYNFLMHWEIVVEGFSVGLKIYASLNAILCFLKDLRTHNVGV